MTGNPREAIVRRLLAAVRATGLYAPRHPLVDRHLSALLDACTVVLRESGSLIIGFLDDEVVVDGQSLSRGRQLAGTLPHALARHGITKITVAPGVTLDELRSTVAIVADTANTAAEADLLDATLDRLRASGVGHVAVGAIEVEPAERVPPGIEGARRTYDSALDTAERFWQAARDGQQPDTASARKVVNTLAQVVSDDRASLMALTTIKRHSAYTFTHMVNVSVLTMALARTLGVESGLVRDFGLAALMHDIGKTRTPPDVLNKPAGLAADEIAAIRRHVIDGSELLWDMSDMPRLAAIVAFEHHLRHDFTGYPERIAPRPLNLCTMIVSIADVFDALRSNRPYRRGLASERVRQMLAEQRGTAFHPTLLKHFIRVVGLFPIGSLVRLETGEVGVVTHEHPGDPFRPQVKVVLDPSAVRLDQPFLLNTWERDRNAPGIAEALDPDEVDLDPLAIMQSG